MTKTFTKFVHSLGFNKGVSCSCFLQGRVSSVMVSADKTFNGAAACMKQVALPAGPSSSSFRQGPFSGSSTALMRAVRTGSETAGLSELTCSHLWSARVLQAQPSRTLPGSAQPAAPAVALPSWAPRPASDLLCSPPPAWGRWPGCQASFTQGVLATVHGTHR